MIVEDNESLREAVRTYLELEGMTVFEFGEIQGASRKLAEIKPDLILLDIMLPDGDGFLFAQRIRKEHQIPIIFLTARAEESDRITGFELGADDYVVKPFSPKELVLRVKAVLNRTQRPESGTVGQNRYLLDDHELQILNSEHRIFLDTDEVMLTAAEWNILSYLAGNAPQVFTRNQILSACLDSIAEGSERTVDTHIKNIRKKTGELQWIETVRGFGYRFNGSTA